MISCLEEHEQKCTTTEQVIPRSVFNQEETLVYTPQIKPASHLKLLHSALQINMNFSKKKNIYDITNIGSICTISLRFDKEGKTRHNIHHETSRIKISGYKTR